MPNTVLNASWLPWRRPRSGAVLVYHRVAELPADPFGQAVRPATFDRQLRMLRRFGSVIPADEMVERLAAGESVRRAIAVTFDDGYVDNLERAVPIAAGWDVPLTIFVTTGPLASGSRFWWDELADAMLTTAVPGTPESQARMEAMLAVHATMRQASVVERDALLRDVVASSTAASPRDGGRPMTPDELRALARVPGVTIGAHTVSHPSLASLDAAEQLAEMRESRLTLERLLDRPVSMLAYPFGKPDNVSDETRRACAAAGFVAGFTTVPMPVERTTGLFGIPRLTMHEWPDDLFAAKLTALVGPPTG